MKDILFVAWLAVILAEPPIIDRPGDLCGIYSVSGKVADGTRYGGVCVVSRPGGDPYRFVWLSPAGQTVHGIGHRVGSTLSVGWEMQVQSPQGPVKMLGVTVYRISEKRLTGRWVSTPGSGVACDKSLSFVRELGEDE